jgi:hypothetical protein
VAGECATRYAEARGQTAAAGRMAAVSGRRLTRANDGWRIPLAGRAVGQCCVDWAVTLHFLEPDEDGERAPDA